METLVLTVAVGVVVGILSGLLGIGGGTLMVPIFRLGFGLSAFASTATSLFTIIPTSLVGFVTHIKNKTCIPKLGIVCGLAGACTSPVGVFLANLSPAWMVMLAAAIIIGYSSFKMFRKAVRMPKNPASGKAMGVDVEKAAVKAAAVEEDLGEGGFELTRGNLPKAIAIGLTAGLASGYVGVGGGFLAGQLAGVHGAVLPVDGQRFVIRVLGLLHVVVFLCGAVAGVDQALVIALLEGIEIRFRLLQLVRFLRL